MKTEPETYSFNELVRDKKTNWNDVRNYQARNHLRQCKKGDTVLIYHSGDTKAVVGIAEVAREGYPDLDEEGGDWTQIDLKATKPMEKSVSLALIKSTETLADLPMLKQSRLSVMPISAKHFKTILKLGATRV